MTSQHLLSRIVIAMFTHQPRTVVTPQWKRYSWITKEIEIPGLIGEKKHSSELPVISSMMTLGCKNVTNDIPAKLSISNKVDRNNTDMMLRMRMMNQIYLKHLIVILATTTETKSATKQSTTKPPSTGKN